MNQCFKCQSEIKPGEVYYRLNKLGEDGSSTGFNTYCCRNCWDNHKQQIIKEDKNIIQVSGEQDNLHQMVYTQVNCSQCNQYKKAQCQCNKREREREENWTGYKCLNCNKEGDISEAIIILVQGQDEENRTKCPNCNSRNLEIKLPVGQTIFPLSSHFIFYDCSQCHLFKDFEAKDNNSNLSLRNYMISEWKKSGLYCTNSSHQLNNPTPRNNSNNRQPSQNQSSNQNPSKFNLKHPLVITGIFVLLLGIIGLVVYLASRNKKKELK